MGERAESWKAHADTLLDVRPVLEQGGEPFVRIMEAAAAIKPGGTLVIIAPFEPVPLYDVLGARGFVHETARVVSDEWVVQFSWRSVARNATNRGNSQITDILGLSTTVPLSL